MADATRLAELGVYNIVSDDAEVGHDYSDQP